MRDYLDDEEYTQEENDMLPAVIAPDACQSFNENYCPVSDILKADLIFTEGKLRETFGAWPTFGKNATDPLPMLISQLADYGFSQRTIPGISGPVILVAFRPL